MKETGVLKTKKTNVTLICLHAQLLATLRNSAPLSAVLSNFSCLFALKILFGTLTLICLI